MVEGFAVGADGMNAHADNSIPGSPFEPSRGVPGGLRAIGWRLASGLLIALLALAAAGFTAGFVSADEPNEVVLRGHEGGVFATQFTPDGERVVTAATDGTARLWDAVTGRELRRFSGHTGPVTGVAVSADGRTLVTSSQDQTLRVWDLPQPRALVACEAHVGRASGLALAADGKTLISTGADPAVRLWDTDRLRAAASATAGGAPIEAAVATITGPSAVIGAAWRPDGTQSITTDEEGRIVLRSPFVDGALGTWGVHGGGGVVAMFAPGNPQQALSAGRDGTIRVWQAPITVDRSLTLASGVRDLLPLPGQPLAVVAREDGGLQIIDVTTWQPVRDLPPGRPVRALAATTDGTTILAGDDAGRVRWHSSVDGAERGAVGGHDGPVLDLATTADGSVAFSAGADGTVRQWARPAARIPLDGHTQGVRRAVTAADGEWFATAGDDATLRIWSGAGQPVRTVGSHTKPPTALAITPDGRGLAVGAPDGGVSLWNPQDGAAQGAILPHRGPVAAITIDRDGSGLWTAGTDGTIKRSRLPFPAPRQWAGHAQPARTVVASADGRLAYSAGQDQTVRQWDLASGQTVRAFGEGTPAGTVTAVATAAGLVAAVTETGAVRAWRVADGAAAFVATVTGVPQRDVVLLPESAGRVRIVSVGDDATLRLWTLAAEPVADGQGVVPVAEVPLPEPGTDRIALSADGTWLATGGAGRIVRRFRVGAEGLAPVEGGVATGAARITDIAFSADGAWFAAAGEDGRLGLWDAQALGATPGDVAPVRVLEQGAALRGLSFAAGAPGARLAAASDDGAVTIWEPSTGALVERFSSVGAIAAVALANGPANGTVIAAGVEPTLRVWTPSVDVVIGVGPASGPGGAVGLVALPGEMGIAALVAGEAALRRFGRDGRPLPAGVTAGAALVHLATSADGRRCVVATAAGEAFVWDLVTNDLRGPVSLGSGVTTLTLPPTEPAGAIGQIVVVDAQSRLRAVDAGSGATVEEWPLPAPAAVVLATGNAAPGTTGIHAPGRHWVVFGAQPQGWLQPRSWMRTLVDAPAAINALAVSTDGSRLCTGGEDGRVVSLRTADGVVERIIDGDAVAIRGLAVIGPTPAIAAACADGAVRIWSLGAESGPRILRQAKALTSVAVAPDGNRLATLAEDGVVQQWSTLTDAPLQSFPGHAPGQGRVRFLSDNLSVVSGSSDRTVRLVKGTALRSVGVASVPIVALVAVGAQAIVAVEDGRVLAIDIAGNAPPRTLIDGLATPIRLALRSDGQRLAVGSADGTIAIRETAGWQGMGTLAVRGAPTALGWSGDGRRLVIASAATAEGPPTLTAFGPPSPAEPAAPGSELVVHDSTPTESAVTALAPDRDGRVTWCTHADGKLRGWAFAGPEALRRFDTGSPVLAVAISRDGGTVVSGGNDQSVRVWDAISGEQRAQMTGHSGPVLALALTPDDAMAVSAAGDQTLRLWDVAGGRALKQLATTDEAIYSLAVHPSGRTVAVGGADRAIHLLDILGGGIERSFRGHADFVHAVAFNRQGSRLLSYGYAGALKVWNPVDGTLLHDAFVGRIGNAAGWGPAVAAAVPPASVDDRIAVACGDGTVRIVIVPVSAR